MDLCHQILDGDRNRLESQAAARSSPTSRLYLVLASGRASLCFVCAEEARVFRDVSLIPRQKFDEHAKHDVGAFNRGAVNITPASEEIRIGLLSTDDTEKSGKAVRNMLIDEIVGFLCINQLHSFSPNAEFVSAAAILCSV